MRRIGGLLAVLCAALATALPAAGQSYPSRPVRIVIPFAAGSGSDIVGRLLADELRQAFNQSFVVENKPGASAQIAAELVAKAPADGYTLMLTTNTAHSANPFLFKSLRYDPLRDFTPIARVVYIPYVLVVRTDSRAASAGALVRELRANPGKLNYGYGNSTSQVAAAAFLQRANAQAVAVPFKSMPPVIGELIAGRLDFAFVDLTSVHGHLKSGQVKPIAFTLASRSAQMPDIPALAETPDLAGYEVTSWVGLVGPAGVPRSVVDALNAEVNRILAKSEIKSRLAELGAETAPGTPDAFAAFLRQQLDSWRTKIAAAGIEPE